LGYLFQLDNETIWAGSIHGFPAVGALAKQEKNGVLDRFFRAGGKHGSVASYYKAFKWNARITSQYFFSQKAKEKKNKKRMPVGQGGEAGLSRFLGKKYYPTGWRFFSKTRRA
jgi:hypothetical protein